MKLRTYVNLWFVITFVLAYECYALNSDPQLSILNQLKNMGQLPKNLDLNPTPGKTISLWLGSAGISTMLLTNLYIFRKRFSALKGIGKLAGWLDFHILCGLLGPTFILFHTNFKIGGLVAISFWSMVVSFSSGIVGRYFYMQLVSQKSDLEKALSAWDQQIKLFQPQVKVNGETMEKTRMMVLSLAGANAVVAADANVIGSVLNSMWGDLRLRFGMSGSAAKLPRRMQEALKGYAVTKRRIIYLEQFRKVMGYWHTFHMPFAVFMYVVAAIHIATALLLQV